MMIYCSIEFQNGFVKMILKYAETWTWWATQTDIYQQTIVMGVRVREVDEQGNEWCGRVGELKRNGDGDGVRDRVRYLLNTEFQIRNFDSRNVRAKVKVTKLYYFPKYKEK